jgi:hypothetical protein
MGSKNSPPTMHQYGMDVGPSNLGQVLLLDDPLTLNDLSEIACMSMALNYENLPRRQPGLASDAMGDPLADQAMYLLNMGSGSYPGNHSWKEPDPERFLVYQVSEFEHAIMDRKDQHDPEITMSTSLLLNPLFA